MKPVGFTGHARDKIDVLVAHGLTVSEAAIKEIIRSPVRIVVGYKGRKIAQGALGLNHVLRIVFEETDAEIVVVTLYPGRRLRYEGTV